MPKQSIRYHWSHESQHTPGVFQRTAFLHILQGNFGGPGLISISQEFLARIVDR